MTQKPRILLAMGTRPEIIKMAPIYFEFKARGVEPIVLHTGQHADLALPHYRFFGFTPDHDLDIRRTPSPPQPAHTGGHDLAELTSALLNAVSSVIMDVSPAAVLVHGDTSSALAAALASFYHQLPVAHIEAGLRSHNAFNPFPEEKNRVLIAQLARWHFAPTERAKRNLMAEGVPESHIHVVGNTIVEAAQLGSKKVEEYLAQAGDQEPMIVQKLREQAGQRKIILVTMHRRENQATNVAQVAKAVRELLERHEDIFVVWPMHPNPKIVSAVRSAIDLRSLPESAAARLHLSNPLSYPLFLWVLEHSWLVLTDSGGIQEETVALRIPVLILRETTERPEVLETGIGILTGSDKDNILKHAANFLNAREKSAAFHHFNNPFGDGTAARRICGTLLDELAMPLLPDLSGKDAQ
ncbi:MAG: UDP-N-acetylglucosamine 2-epimerase (non-hydrolyzing) [Pseudomonadota bacterium]|nr:UDP-N-acetylglucosamine 2-epimerase (non-hydrolyzing) [Pseudomonadota bacterium]